MNKAITFILVFKILCVGTWVLDDTKESCATLYTETNQTGSVLIVENAKVFPNLASVQITNVDIPQDQDNRKSAHWSNKVKSVQVDENCALRVCNETLFAGECMTFKNDIPTLPKVWMKKISSVGCACEQPECAKPKCGSVRIKRRECGRAFIEPGCSTCKNVFVTLKKGANRYIGGNFGKNIKSVKVKSGCNLTVYDDLDFEGEEAHFEAGNYEIWSSKIGSYNCICEKEGKGNATKDRNNAKKPIMLDFPMNSNDVIELEQNYTRHKGLLASLTSLRNRRSARNAYILVVGMTGSGKSATINFLFDNATVAEVGSSKSTTKLIHEYHIPVPVEELGIKNSELVIIDTPGLGDTDGLENDAKFLATLEDFLIKHVDLHDKIPNIVLIFGRFHDNRSKGKASNFVKTLRGIDLLKEKLFDGRFSNAIFIFTHYMSVRKSIARNPWSKIQSFRETIEEFTLIPKPISICVAENEPVDQELPMINGFYLLPNGDYYPQNVFKKIQEVTTGGGDPIGEAIIRNAFKRPEDMQIREETTPLHNMNSSRVDYFFSILNSADIDSSTTEVSNLTKMAYESFSDDFLKTDVKNSLSLLQRSLNVRNIFTLNDVPKSTVDILKLLKGVRNTNVTMAIMENALGVKTPEMATPILVGNCYDLLKDTVLEFSPFQQDLKKPSDIGYLIPNIVTLKMVNKPQQVFYLYENRNEYLQSRLRNLGVSGDPIKSDMLYGSLRPGFNILAENHTGDVKLTALREHKLFQVTLNDRPPLKQEFLDEIQQIGNFNQTDHENVAAWSAFFSKYGTHVVQSAFGGGAIEVYLHNVRNPNVTVNADQIREQMGKTLKFLFRFVDDLYIGRTSDVSRLTSEENIKYKLMFSGGDYNLAAPDFSKFDVVGIMSRLNSWDESLRYQPLMLQSYMTLLPLSQVLRRDHVQLSDKVSTAAKAFYNASLVYVPPPPPPPPPPREDTRKITELTKSFNEQIDKLTKTMDSERSNFTSLTQKLLSQLSEERLAFLKQLEQERASTLHDVALTCFYELKGLKGTKLCGAMAHTCVNYRVSTKSPLSVNTYNSCIEIFPSQSCSGGTSYRHKSNTTTNTDFPTSTTDGWFSAQMCAKLPQDN